MVANPTIDPACHASSVIIFSNDSLLVKSIDLRWTSLDLVLPDTWVPPPPPACVRYQRWEKQALIVQIEVPGTQRRLH